MEFGTFVYPKRKFAVAATDYIDKHDLTGEWYLHRNTHSSALPEEKWVLDVCFEKTPKNQHIEAVSKGGKFLGFEGVAGDTKAKGDDD